MPGLPREPLIQRTLRWMQQNQDTAFAISIAAIAALFIIGIVSAFTYASSDVSASRPAAPPALTGSVPTGTTGAGSGDRPRPPLHDPREDEQMERPR
jgi:hypothetical protein